MGLKKGFVKVLLLAGGAGGLVYGYHRAVESGLIKPAGFMQALVPEKAVLPDVKEAKVASNVTAAPLPDTAVKAEVAATQIRCAVWEWNADQGFIFANGGAETVAGSLMAKHGVNLLLYRQDDTNQMQDDLSACAKELAGGAKQCSHGANCAIIMGDGAGQFAAAANPKLAPYGDQWKVVVIGSPGYSRGEDAFMAPPNVKSDPQNAKGLLVSGVIRDGDWNIPMKWAADNNIKNNPDEKTYDPDAINWINSADYNTAAADYVAGKCEERKLVENGVLTTKTKRVCVNATVTWTPGDVTVVQKKGGLVKVVSSKEYRSQMPAVIIGPKQFFNDNRTEVQNMLAAMFEGGDQVKTFDAALKSASEISAKLYKDQDGAFWYKYYKGTIETDMQGNKVSLGGSAVNNLGDNLILFGLLPGTNDNFRSTYTTFSNIVMQQYPELFKKDPIPDVKEIEDKSFVTGAQALMTDPGTAPDLPSFDAPAATVATTGTVISKRNYNINFDTGKASLTQQGVRQLNDLRDGLAITGLYIEVEGHTDNTGDEQRTNLPLSKARAEAIKSFLQQKAPETFPDQRFVVKGYGSAKPVASNTTPDGRAANRRVQIILLEN